MHFKDILKKITTECKSLDKISRHYPSGKVKKIRNGERYISCIFKNIYGITANGIINIDHWFGCANVQLPGLPWESVPLSYLAKWLKTQHIEFTIENQDWILAELNIEELEDESIWFALPTEPCPILCQNWPHNSFDKKILKENLIFLPHMINLTLGSSKLSLEDTVGINIGDIIHIEKLKFFGEINHHKLFTFDYSGADEIIIKEILMEHLQKERGEETMLLKWEKLPVDIEFVLDSKKMCLGEIDQLDVGVALPLNNNAQQQIKIYLNRKLYASGELVLIEENGLAVEIKTLIDPENCLIGHNDVE